MNSNSTFEAYLHNPFGYLNIYEKSCIQHTITNMQNQNLNIDDELEKLIYQYFKNFSEIHHTGLQAKYRELKTFIINSKQFGLILYGTQNGSENIFQVYNTNDNKILKLNIKTICKILISDYFSFKESNDICKSIVSKTKID